MNDPPWILDDLPVGVWVGTAPEGTVAYTNRTFERILGMPGVAGSPIEDAPRTYGIVDRRGNPFPIEKLPFAQVLATGGSVTVEDIVARRPGGDVYVRAFGTPVFGADKKTISHVIVAFLDITKEVQAEKERAQIEYRLQLICNHAPIAVWMTDPNGKLTLSEGAGLKVLGVEPGELVGKNVLELYKDHPTIPGYIGRGLAGEALWYTVQVGEAVYDTWLTPVWGNAGEMLGIAAISNDVSQLRKLQRTAIQNDRVMALGTLAASVAHEINNPLTYILAHAQAVEDEIGVLEGLLARLDGPAVPQVRASLDRLRGEIAPLRLGTNRIAGITRDLRTFSRADETGLSPVDIRVVVESVLRLVAKEVEARARLVVDLQHTFPVLGSEGRLVQVILNLVVNAIQALPSDNPAGNEVIVRTRSEGSEVIVEVSDSGPGVRPGDREQIFEPFFSTKEIGQGTGLGLFVCRNIVRGLSGQIEVADRPGGGALFRVTLPAAVAASAPAPREVARPPRTGDHHVVVIEDDPMVGRALALQLREHGYRVTLVGDARTGLATLRSAPVVDLVFCDLMMTGMTGMDLADAVATELPQTLEKIVFMTGGAFSARAREFVGRHQGRTVDKPFDIVEETRRRLEVVSV